MASHLSKHQTFPTLFIFHLHFSHRPPMAKPSSHLPSLAPPDPDSVANPPTCPKLESAMAAAAAPKPSPFTKLHNQPLVAVSSMINSKPRLQKFDNEEKELKGIQKGHCPDSMRPTVSLLRKGGRTKSFAASQVELIDIFAKNGMKVVSVDMPPAMQIHAVDCARKAHDSMEKFTSKALALSLKREFDGAYGPVWHCIVGTSFGSFVTHSVGGFLYLSMDQKLYVLLFKTSVQRAD
ncbi:uncharacterized protein LOC111490306 isoform X2 [Cucurbita maxima]|uniref:Uncharacterized protein LOC111490306 isoform X2 n=1 Tax=Cucurbita maxima TaxID=3661 RepID=A0A6J1JWH6_CUCMA|nr:uncharacterized protein LOC111490306 isoform X2 [Cucurbita maxima]